MPSIQQRDCTQDAVLWPLGGYGDDGLAYALPGTAEEIKVRWSRRLSSGTDAKGNAVTTSVSLAVVRLVNEAPARVPLDSFVRLGTLDDIPGTNQDAPTTDLWQVVTEQHAADVRGREERFEYGLMRCGDRLPLAPT